MGEIPKTIVFAGKHSLESFNRKGPFRPPFPCSSIKAQQQQKQLLFILFYSGELRHINKLRYWPLDCVLHDKYLFPKGEADTIASFLTPMLRLHPDKRAKAADLVHHNSMDGVLVQGEIDVIRRVEETGRGGEGEFG
jgi:serine/threonine-protein kinase SRPK3